MNKLVLTGRPTADPEVHYSGNGDDKKMFVTCTVAANYITTENGQKVRKADFIPCIAFGKVAKTFEEHIKKGAHILVTGPMRNNNYTSKEGDKVYGFRMTIETVEFLDKKENSQPATDEDGYMNVSDLPDGEVPFN